MIGNLPCIIFLTETVATKTPKKTRAKAQTSNNSVVRRSTRATSVLVSYSMQMQ
jgi:hypothetical protein